MRLLPIYPEIALNEAFAENPDCLESLQIWMDFYPKIGYHPPWIGYYAEIDNQLVGGVGFKGKPKDGKVEIAYGTFEQYRQKGIASRMCQALVELALQTDPSVRITARTLPEENFSVRLLRKNNFVWIGEVLDEEDGNVWEWEYIKIE